MDGDALNRTGWEPNLDSSPSQITPAPLLSQLDLLPIEQMGWEDFERLMWRILRDVEGLRYATLYGERGQAQFGLDVVALAPNGSAVALQAKRYQKFQASDLKKAIDKFGKDAPPFEVSRLIIGVSQVVDSRQVKDLLGELRESLLPMQLELWDKREISDLLRRRPEIVIEFFGMPTAQRFCAEFTVDLIRVPNTESTVVRDALARTPESAINVRVLLDRASAISVEDPTTALDLIETAQQELRRNGFPAHAAAHEERRRELLVRLGRSAEAANTLLSQMWEALDYGRTQSAQSAAHTLSELVRNHPKDSDDATELHQADEVARRAIAIALSPFGGLPSADSLEASSTADGTKLLLLAGETALALMDSAWLVGASTLIQRAISGIESEEPLLKVRLRLLLTEVDDDWSGLLDEARRGLLGYEGAAIVKARYARRCALRMEFSEAEREWHEAIGDACLAQHWEDASRWIFGLRVFSSRFRPFAGDELFPMQIELATKGPQARIIPVDDEALSRARGAQLEKQYRSAAGAAYRAVRDAVVLGSWAEEQESRRALGHILEASGEPEMAAAQFLWSGDAKAAKALGESAQKFVDVVPDLTATNYWHAAAAFQLIAAEADLVPDEVVTQIAGQALEVLHAARAGRLIDLQGFASSVFGNATKALAGISSRVLEEEARAALSWFEEQGPVEPGHYRFHDENEARIIANIGAKHRALLDRCLSHLIPLLSRSELSRKYGTELVSEHTDLVYDKLAMMAAGGDDWAVEMLSVHEMTDPESPAALKAFSALTTPLAHKPGVFTMGTNAVAQSLLLRGIEPEKAELVVTELLQRANDPQVGSSDRASYLLAASNVVDQLSDGVSERLFALALEIAGGGGRESAVDQWEGQFGHPLGSLRIHGGIQVQPHAVYLAARLASTAEQRRAARNAAFALMGSDESDYWVTRALQNLTEDLEADLGYLVGQGWALRSLAAIVWAKEARPEYIGARLAVDPDVRVRRGLARELAQSPVREADRMVREQLAGDRWYSVRAALSGDVKAV